MKTRLILNFIILAGVFVFFTCRKYEYKEFTSDDRLIGQLLEENPDFTLFAEMLEYSGNLSFLNAYGTYTCFAPTNAAIGSFLSSKGLTSVDQIDADELQGIVRYHIIKDTLGSTAFNDGKLKTPTMYGQYLTVGTYFEGGTAIKKINKQIERASGAIKSPSTSSRRQPTTWAWASSTWRMSSTRNSSSLGAGYRRWGKRCWDRRGAWSRRPASSRASATCASSSVPWATAQGPWAPSLLCGRATRIEGPTAPKASPGLADILEEGPRSTGCSPQVMQMYV